VNRGDQRPQSWLRRRRAASGSARSVFVAWVAILALVAQLAAAVQTHAMAAPAPSDAAAALSALQGLLGPNVALCARDESSAPTRDSHKCCDDCALRHAASHSALAPAQQSASASFARYAESLGAPTDPRPARPRSVAFAQPRGPPALV